MLKVEERGAKGTEARTMTSTAPISISADRIPPTAVYLIQTALRLDVSNFESRMVRGVIHEVLGIEICAEG